VAISPQAVPQYQNPDWIEVSPAGESFHVSMPGQMRVDPERVGSVSGYRYATLTPPAAYTIWSLTNADYRSDVDTDTYLDDTAELLWEGLLRPARESLDDKARRYASMTIVRETSRKDLPGREYTLAMGDVTGTTQLFVAHEHIYIMLVMGKPGGNWSTERFFSSFKSSVTLPTPTPTPTPDTAALSIPSATDYNRIFSGKEVTAKARVLEKTEPTYSDSARKFGVQGTVVLRCVFSKDGDVTNIRVVSKLPHGLTQKAIEAAQRIRFTPAMKDGQPVSMWMELQYNFNLF